MATIKSYTDIEQSKKLAEILPLESADMRYHTISQYNQYPCDEIVYTIDFGKPSGIDIPCWSLAALLDVVSEEVSLNSFKDGNWNVMVQQNGKMIYGDKDNPVDACYEMIKRLNELKML